MESNRFFLWVFVGGKEEECKSKSAATEFRGESSSGLYWRKKQGMGDHGLLAIL